jgi:hypothetical protein
MRKLLIVLLVHVLAQTFAVIPTWKPLEPPSTRFSSAHVPLEASAIYYSEFTRHNPIMIFADDSPAVDICSNYTHLNCTSEEFIDEMMTMLNTNRTAGVMQFNHCLYCQHETELFDRFRSTLQHHCQFPVLFAELIDNETISSEIIHKPETASDFVMCYCGDGGGWRGNGALFGYRCDSYTRQWVPLAYRYTPMSLAILLIVLFVFDLCFLFIPRLAERIKSAKSQRGTLLQKVFDIRLQTIALLILSIFFLIIEQMIIIMNTYYSVMTDFQRMWIPGFARKVSLMFLGTCYATTLVQWIHILVDNQQGNSAKLSYKLKAVIGFIYLSVVSLLFLTLVLNYTFHVPKWITHLIFAITAGLYLIVFPMSFTISGIKLFLALRKYSTSFGKLKFIWFVVATDLVFVFGFVDGVLIIISYIAGWDYFGYLFGMFGTALLDVVSVVVYFLLMYILFNGKLFCKIERESTRLDSEISSLVFTDEQDLGITEAYPFIPVQRRHSTL